MKLFLIPLLPSMAFRLSGQTDKALKKARGKACRNAIFINNRWCHPGHTVTKERICSLDIELLAVGLRSNDISREFTHAIIVTVYLPPPPRPML